MCSSAEVEIQAFSLCGEMKIGLKDDDNENDILRKKITGHTI